MTKCVFLDRDGVINKDDPNYVFHPEKFKLLPHVFEALDLLKKQGYLLIVITNQSGIAQKKYSRSDMETCHKLLHAQTDNIIDQIYFSPWHPSVSNSLSRKPDSLLFEKAIARFEIIPNQSWMIGDRERDLIPAKKLGIKTISVGENKEAQLFSDVHAAGLWEAAQYIVSKG